MASTVHENRVNTTVFRVTGLGHEEPAPAPGEGSDRLARVGYRGGNKVVVARTGTDEPAVENGISLTNFLCSVGRPGRFCDWVHERTGL